VRDGRGTELLGFVCAGEAVAALDLGGGGPVLQHAVVAHPAQTRQALFRGLARRLDRHVDAPAAGEDLGVGHPGKALPVLGCPGPGERHVGVRVDEAGEHAATLRVDVERIGLQFDRVAQILLAADPHDGPVAGGEGAPVDDSETLRRRSAHRHEL